MKKLLILLLTATAFAQNPQRTSYAVQNNAGYLKVIPNASITLCTYDPTLQCNSTVGIFSDPALTQPIGYPFYANANGYFNYYTNAGNYVEQQCFPGGGCVSYQISFTGGGSGSGSVTTFSAGNAAPLFTTSVTNPTSTPALSFAISNAGQNTVLAGPPTGGAGAPTYQTAPTFSGANLTGLPFMSLTTAGSSGAATLASGVLNIPVYSGGSVDPLANQISGYAVEADSPTTALTRSFPMDDGVTNAGDVTIHKGTVVNDGSGNAGRVGLVAGTLPGNVANAMSWIAPTSVTPYRAAVPGQEPTVGTFLTCTAADPALCSWSGSSVWVTDPPFNATCDGTTDDHVAIQAALDSGAAIVNLPVSITSFQQCNIGTTGVTVPAVNFGQEFTLNGNGSGLAYGGTGTALTAGSASIVTNIYIDMTGSTGTPHGIDIAGAKLISLATVQNGPANYIAFDFVSGWTHGAIDTSFADGELYATDGGVTISNTLLGITNGDHGFVFEGLSEPIVMIRSFAGGASVDDYEIGAGGSSSTIEIIGGACDAAATTPVVCLNIIGIAAILNADLGESPGFSGVWVGGTPPAGLIQYNDGTEHDLVNGSQVCTVAFPCSGGGSSIVASAEVVSFSATPTFSTAVNTSRIVLTNNITSFTLGAGSDGQDKTLCFKQGAGPYTVAPPAGVHGFLTIGTVSGDWNCQSFNYDNTDSIWLSTGPGTVDQ